MDQYIYKRKEWMDWLEFDEHQAIKHQVQALLWSDASFRLINEARRYASEAGGRFAVLNPIIVDSIDRGYISEQLFIIRRLMEPASRRPERQVISLRRLIDDVYTHRRIICRSKYIEACKCVGGPSSLSERSLSQTFDQFTGERAGNAPGDDSVSEEYFDWVERTLNLAPIQKISSYANKYVLHSADNASRTGVDPSGVCLDEYRDCHSAITSVAAKMSLLVTGRDLGGVPRPMFDPIQFWEASFAPPSDFPVMMDEWEQGSLVRDG